MIHVKGKMICSLNLELHRLPNSFLSILSFARVYLGIPYSEKSLLSSFYLFPYPSYIRLHYCHNLQLPHFKSFKRFLSISFMTNTNFRFSNSPTSFLFDSYLASFSATHLFLIDLTTISNFLSSHFFSHCLVVNSQHHSST